MRRLFAGFELASPRARSGSGVLRGRPWAANEARDYPFRLEDGYCLLPYFRPEAIDLARDDGVGFPTPGRSALSDFLCSVLSI
jgi:hypothetical protein